MKISPEEQGWQEEVPVMYEELDRIRGDQELIVEARNLFLNGKATKEQIFLAINAAATNMVVFREVYENNIRILVEARKVFNRSEKTVSKRENRKVKRHPVVSPVPATNIVPFTKNGRKGVRI